MKKFLLICALTIAAQYQTQAQVPTCDTAVPYFLIDFTGNPTGVYVSPGHSREANCCGTSFPDRCTSFEIICDTNTAMINFEIASGAVPTGSMFYQIGCGPQIPVGEAICISGPNPHYLTFCKPGNNQNTYRVTSIAKPTFPPDDTTRIGCSLPISVLGMVESSVTWNSVYPGAPGAFNSYLSCTSNCDTAIYTPADSAPPYVDYVICGTPIATDCGFIFSCDTVRIYNYPALDGLVSPNPGGFCSGGSGVTLTASASGGLAPYTFQWRDNALALLCPASSCLLTSEGSYSVEIRDQLYDSTFCPSANISATVVVTDPPDADAGPDQTLCPTNPVAVLSGSMANAAGGIWTGGTGTFYPSDTSLLTSYTPTAAEIAAGSVTLKLKSTGVGGGCDNDSDLVTIFFPDTLVITVTNVNVNCYGDMDTLESSVSGGIGPYTYQWTTGQTTSSIFVGEGTYCLTVTDSLGCTASECATLFAPPSLFISMSATPCTTNGGSDGTASTSVSGGTSPYSYLWNTGDTTSTIMGLSYGVYTVTATDANGCTIYSSVVVNEPRCNLYYAASYGSDINCFGDNDGSATATPVNGTPPFTYLWNDPSNQTTATAINLGSGTYECTITDDTGCVATVNISLTQPAQLMNTMTHTDVSMIGGSDGSACANPTGGTPAYTYSWNTSEGTQCINSLTSGTYSVLITDANNCTVEDSVIVNEPPCSGFTAGVSRAHVSCNGLSDGTASAIVILGNDPFSYVWSTGDTTSSVSGLAAGNYSLTITDSINCAAFINFAITQPSPLSIALAPTDVRCHNTNDGTIELTVNGGTFPYTYSWSNGQTTEDVINLSDDTYSVTVTDNHGCTASDSATVNRPTEVVVSTTVTPVTCNGGSDGAVDATVTGGIAPYIYSWSNSATTEDISGLSAGEYLLIATDANNCSSSPAFSSLVDEPDTVKIVGAVAECSVPGSGVTEVTLSASGGNPGEYQFSVDGGTTWLPSGVDSVFLPVDSTYTIVVRDTFGCVSPDSFVLVIAPAPEITAVIYNGCVPDGIDSILITLTVTGGSGGSLQASFDNGTTWQAPGDYDAYLLTGVSYSIIIRDSSGCISVTENITISTDLELSGTTSTYAGGYEISCNGNADGSIDLSVTGGNPGYNYDWSNGSTTQDISGLTAATYSVIVTDTSGCSDTISFTLTEPPALSATIASVNDFNGYEISCNGSTDGAINVTVSGGVATYNFIWSNSETTEDLSGLAAGSYTVTITDANGCTFSTNITLSEPPALALDDSIQNVMCNGFATGSIDITVTGGVTTYTYAWSTGATSEDINGLIAGLYSVLVTDQNSCTISDTFNISEPDTIVVTSDVSDFNGFEISCSDTTQGGNGSIDLTVSGGVGPYTFAWSNGASTEDVSGLGAGSYSVTVTDANGCTQQHSFNLTAPPPFIGGAASTGDFNGYEISCNGGTNGSIDLTISGGVPPYTYAWSNGATSEDISNLGAGTYSVTVTDQNGCTFSDDITLSEPPALAMDDSVQSVLCNGFASGSIDITVTGGVAPYSYIWSNVATTEDISLLVVGTYSVLVTDQNGCTITGSFNITEPDSVVVTSDVSDFNGFEISCSDTAQGGNGSIDLTVSGGVSPYTFNWSNGATTEDLSGLGAGSYSVTVTDANGCSQQLSFNLTAPPPFSGGAASAGNFNGYEISCNGGTNGAIDLTISGGVPPYTYSWSNGATSEDISGLGAGSYTVTVTDQNGCTFSDDITLSEPPALAISSDIDDVLCNGFATGEIDITVTGGVPAYTYAWSNGASSQDISGLVVGSYSVLITDQNGCSISGSFNITEPSLVVITSVLSDYYGYEIKCNGASNGSIDLTVSGGVPPYTYNWSNGATTEDINSIAAGTYSVTVTDNNGCTQVHVFNLTEPPALTATLVSVYDYNGYEVKCKGGTSGAVDLTVSGGLLPYTYNWSNGATSEDLANLGAGTYSVTITDLTNCTIQISVTLSEPPGLDMISAVTDVLCHGNATGAIDLTITGGVPGYSYVWSNGSSDQDLDGIIAGTYSVTVLDENGCMLNASFTITEPAPLVVNSIVSDYNGYGVSCFGKPNGFIDLTVTGGVSPYNFNWSNGAATEDLSVINAGSYTVTVTDANGCTVEIGFTLTEPPALFAAITSVNNFNGYDISCNGNTDGTIDLSVGGGVPAYTYTWSNGATSEDISNLAAGTYSVTITDLNSCIISASITLTEPPILDMTASSQHIQCNGAATGSVDITVSGGVLPYTYSWSNGSTTEDISGLTAGSYSILVTDQNGCTFTASFNLTEPPAMIIASALSDYNGFEISCNGQSDGSIDLIVSGGAGPYTYNWSNGSTSEDQTNLSAGTYSVVITDANGCSQELVFDLSEPITLAGLLVSANNFNEFEISCNGSADGAINLAVAGGVPAYAFSWSNGSTSQNISNLTAGSYSVMITDQNGCTFTGSIDLSQPEPMVNSAVAQDILCNGFATGSIDQTTTGGVYPYTYLWSNGSTSQDLVNLGAGVYSVVITDANGCELSPTYNIDELAPLNALGILDQPLCDGDGNASIDLVVIGGTAPYNYNWSNGATTEDISNLSEGAYSVTVTDNNGCFDINTFYVVDPIALVANANSPVTSAGFNISHYGMSDGSIDLTAEGGIAPYIYLWSNGATTEDLSGLPAGTYSVIVTDANGCTTSDAITLTAPLILEMPTGFSPNGDGHNDFFEVHGIEAYPNNHIEVYNRWGQLVWDADNYSNKWAGTNETGDELPDATYFVILNINDGQIILKGYVDIRRQ